MALAFTRREGESFRIGQDILIEVATIADRRVKLRITAPKHIRIMRTEIDNQPLFDQGASVAEGSDG